MPMASPIDAPKMCPMKTNGKRMAGPKEAITLRLATTMQSTGSTSAAFVSGSASLPSPPTVVNAREDDGDEDGERDGQAHEHRREELHRELGHRLRLRDPREHELGVRRLWIEEQRVW